MFKLKTPTYQAIKIGSNLHLDYANSLVVKKPTKTRKKNNAYDDDDDDYFQK